VGILTALPVLIIFYKAARENSSVLKMGKLFSVLISFYPFFRTECTMKESAEKYPKNFALIRLAEKTLAKQ
jgi:hypothetical protein